jgi:hypothetical protein
VCLSPKTVGIPRTPDGKADFSAKTPRTPDGRPNLSGLWTIETEEFWEDIGAGLKPEEVPRHEQIGDPTLADGILDRLVHNAHRIEMLGDSMRKNRGKANA